MNTALRNMPPVRAMYAKKGSKLDWRIAERVLRYRRSGPGSKVEAFKRNYAAVIVKNMDTNTTEVIDALNWGRKGPHSEEELRDILYAIGKRKNLKVLQIFSERRPCQSCIDQVIHKFWVKGDIKYAKIVGDYPDIFYLIHPDILDDRYLALMRLYLPYLIIPKR